MADRDSRLNLVQRLAEKQAARDDRPLSERAVEKISAQPSAPTDASPKLATQTAAPANDKPHNESEPEKPAHGEATQNYAVIDLIKLQLAGNITPNSQQTRIAEEYRTIKRPLLLKAFGAPESRIPRGNVIMVTSARPSEGKTFTAINLAMSIASERDLHVLLIDTDVYKRELSMRLGISADRGLVDLLIDEDLELPDVLVRTNISNLTVLPPGAHHPAAPELLASQRMAALMKDVTARYSDRIIIIDSPPILASSEPGVLALLVGQVVMVVEGNKTDRHTLEQSLQLISTCEHINFVLNKATTSFGSGQYSAYTYYDEYRK